MKSTFAALLLAGLLQACATPVLNAPPAPCASTESDCGPARPVNWSVAWMDGVVDRISDHG